MQWTVVGHQREKQRLDRQLRDGSFPHAHLFTGPDGIGKRAIAFDVARQLLAVEHSVSANPDCRVLAPTTDPESGKPSDIAVEEIREMKAWLYQRPLYAPRKAVILDDADRLGAAAANTLLKVLEEPPAYATFLLVTSRPGSVLPTVRSRCQQMSFLPLTDEEMEVVLVDAKLGASERELLRSVAQGRPGIALELIRGSRVPEVEDAVALLRRLPGMDIATRLIAVKELSERTTLTDVVSWWLSWTHAQLPGQPQLASVAHGLIELSSAVSEPKHNRRLALERFVLELR